MGLERALQSRWTELCRRGGIDDPAAEARGVDLVRCYREAHRHYHGLEHLSECLCLVDELVDLEPESRVIAEFALWFHDAVYIPTAMDNEIRSAGMAVAWLDGVGFPGAAEVGRLVEMTSGHRGLDGVDREAGAAVHDADLAILGAASDRYDDYAGQIRLEYSHLSDADFAAGRRGVLDSFLARPQIFLRPDVRSAREERARTNIARELASLAHQDL